ncbi:MAG: hypothetical protein V4736_12720, partial [Bdellovibrionota bacterium]
ATAHSCSPLPNPGRDPFFKKIRSQEALITAAELLGRIQGEKLFAAWSQRKLPRGWVHQSLKSSLKVTNLPKIYYAMVKKLENVSLDFTSKAEKI